MDPFVESLEVSPVIVVEDVVEIQPYNPSIRDDMNDMLEPEAVAPARDSISPHNQKEVLNRDQKKVLSKLYKLGKNLSKTISNVEFQKQAEANNITSKHFNFQKRGFLASVEKLSEAKEKLSEASEVLREGAKEFFIAKRNEQEDKIVTTTEILGRICEKSLFDSVILK